MNRLAKFEFFTGAVFVVVFVFFAISLSNLNHEANTLTPTSQLEITFSNDPPTVSSSNVKICAGTATAGEYASCSDISSSSFGITLTAGGTDSNTIVFLGEDNDGASNLAATAEAVFYHYTLSSPVGSTCTASNRYCYRDMACNKGFSASASSAYYGCNLNMAYYASRTDISAASWETWVQVHDAYGSTANTTALNEEVNTVVALTFADIPFGDKALGYEGDVGDSVQVEHLNMGNAIADFYLKANSDLGCDGTGTVPATALKFDPYSSRSWQTSAHTLSATATVDFSDLNSPIRQSDTATASHMDYSYWQIKMPDSDISGSCIATITAISY